MKKVIVFLVYAFCFSSNAFADTAQIEEDYGKIPLAFTLNRGQTDSQVKFTNSNSMLWGPEHHSNNPILIASNTINDEPNSDAKSPTPRAADEGAAQAVFTMVKRGEGIVTNSKGGASKVAKVSSIDVGNSYIRASVSEQGEVIIWTTTSQSLLYPSYTGRTNVRIDGVSHQFGYGGGTWTTPLSVSSNFVTGVWTIGDIADHHKFVHY